MGSTGHGIYKRSKTGNVNTETFGIEGAVNYKGKVPKDSGLEPVGSNKITLKLPAGRQSNIIFQFKLSKDNSMMTIIGYKDGMPEVKCKVQVDSGHPSLDKVIAMGSKTEKMQAIKMKDLMHKSSKVSEDQLSAIANKLIRNKNGGKA
jgi:hypothetical protein